MRRGAVVVVLLAALLPGCSTARDGTAARLSGAVPTSADSQDPREPPRLGAWYVAEVAGTPGAFVPHQVVGTHLQVPCGGPGRCFQPGLQLTAAAVGRSPATAGAQVVLVLENVYALNGLGGWFVQQQDAHQITIPAGQPVGYTLDRSWLLATGGAKHVKLVLIWADETGRALGMQGIHMSDAGDYVCRTRFAWACGVGEGPARVARVSPTRRVVAVLITASITASALLLAGTLLAVSPAVSLPGGQPPASARVTDDRAGTLLDFGRRDGRAVLPWTGQDIAAAPTAFRAFVRGELRRLWREELGHRPACKTSPVITLDALRTDGFALGDVATRPRRGCETGGGYIAIWAVRAGAWKQVIGTQEAVECRRLERYDIPAELGIDSCYRGGELVPYTHP